MNTEIDDSLSVAADISKLFLDQSTSDICFIVDDKRIVAHTILLSARSNTFDKMFGENKSIKNEIHIQNASSLAFKNLIKYFYTGRVYVEHSDEKELHQLLSLAIEYDAKELAERLAEPQSQTAIQPNNSLLKLSNLTKPKHIDNGSIKLTKDPKLMGLFEDMANTINGAVVLYGLNTESLFSKSNVIRENECTRHILDFPYDSQGIIIKLSIPLVLNVIKFRLWDKHPKRYYAYRVSVSFDYCGWQIIASDSKYTCCRSWQTLFFDQRLVQYIKLLGVSSNESSLFSGTQYFTITSFMCGLAQNPLKMLKGYLEPQTNMATTDCGAVVIVGERYDYSIYCPNAKMIADKIEYSAKYLSGFCSEFQFDIEETNELVVQLPQPIYTSSIRFYIESKHKFKYAVRVTSSNLLANGRWKSNCELVADKRISFNDSGWQIINFPKRVVLFIIIGKIQCDDESVDVLPILSFLCP